MNHRKRTRPGDARGFTLVETMVALVLFTIIGVAVYQILIHTSQSERVSTTVAEAQQNARVALDTILRDLRQAGYGIDTSSEVPIETASEYRVTFVIDQDADGVIEAGESITYFMDDNAADPQELDVRNRPQPAEQPFEPRVRIDERIPARQQYVAYLWPFPDVGDTLTDIP